MKKIHFIIGILALAVCGCVKETIVDNAPAEEMVKLRLSTIAPHEVVGVETRTELNENLSVSWQSGDEVIMFCNSPSGYNFVNVAADGPFGFFEGSVPRSWISSEQPEWVVYPSTIKNWGANLSVQDWGWSLHNLVYPDAQPLVAGSFGRGYNLSVAVTQLHSDGSPLYFQNICALLCVSLNGNATVNKMTITSPGNVAGKMKLKLDNGVGEAAKLEIQEVADGSKTMTLNAEEGITLTKENQKFYACVLPYSETGEYTVAVTTVEGKTVTKTADLSRAVQSGYMIELTEMEVNFTFVDADGTTYEIDPSGNKTLDLYYLPSDGALAIDAPDWLTYQLDEAEGKITFSAGPYLSVSSRSDKITITQGEASAEFTVDQDGLYIDYADHVFEMDPAGVETAELPYAAPLAEAEITVPEWLTYTVNEAEGKILFSAGVYVSSTSRSGEVVISLGGNEVRINAAQDGFYQEIAGKPIEIDPTGAESFELPYAVSVGIPEVTVPEWLTYTVNETEGKIVFTAGAYVAGTPRTGEIVIAKGSDSAVLAVSQKGIALVSLSTVYSDAEAHEGYVIEKSAFFTEEYTLVEELDWLTASKNGAGNIVLSVDANGTGAVRTGDVLMKVGDNVVQTINVIQTTFNYSTFLGNYRSDCKFIDNTVSTFDAISVKERAKGSVYVLTFAVGSYHDYTMLCDYTPIGAGFMTLICPQESEMAWSWGNWVPTVRPSKRHSNANFRLTVDNYQEINVVDGCGFNLVPVIVDGAFKGFDFVPDAHTQELYPEGIDGLWFPELRTTKKVEGTNDPLEWDTNISNGQIDFSFRALDGQDYLRITKK